jgi:putative transposase
MGHTFTRHLYHIVFSTKGRRALLATRFRDELYAYMAGVARNVKGFSVAIGGTSDHVHCLCEVAPSVAVADFVGKVKSNSSRWIERRFKDIGPFDWQIGYGSFTVSESKRQDVVRYIANQTEHHRKRTFAEELAGLLEKHGIAYDPEHYLD